MSNRRKPQSNSKQGQPTKKLKTDGPDIPSSNFAAKPKPQQQQQFTKYPARVNPETIKSMPQTNLNIANPTAILKKMGLADMYKEVMEPDINEYKRLAKEKARKEEELKRKRELEKPMLEKLRKEQEEERQREKEAQPKDLILDDSGRLLDNKRNIVNLNPTGASSLKVNINKNKQEKVKELLKLQRGTGVNRSSKLFDPMLQSRTASLRDKRKNNAFHFIEKGSILHKGDMMRGQTDDGVFSQDQMAVEDGAIDKSAQKLSTPQVGIRRIAVKVKRHDPIPDVEWWDAPLLPPDRKSYLPEEYLAREKEGIQKEKYEGRMEEETPNEGNSMNIEKDQKQSLIERYQSSLQYLESDSFTGEIYQPERITHMVEHPASFKTDGGNQNVIIPTYLTEDERKKLRRKRRLEREKDKQEKISLGLMKPPPPKVKYSNFMNIMKDEAVLDPTKVEMEVKKAIQDRLQAHLDRNEKKKLTKEQRAEKSMRKLRRDSALECRVAVFRIEDLSNGQQRFKVNMNAQQLALNGVCIVADKKLGLNLPNVVVVEGGPKAIKFYKKLMLRRVKWNHRPQKEATGEVEAEKTVRPAFENKCTLVWEGVLKDHNFNKWKVVDIKSELEGRRVLTDRGVEFYWDRALTGEATQDLDDD